jgi:hypothetical protein
MGFYKQETARREQEYRGKTLRQKCKWLPRTMPLDSRAEGN